MTPQEFMQWAAIAQQAFAMGVRSWSAIKALLDDAGADDESIEVLRGKWDGLYADVQRAAGG